MLMFHRTSSRKLHAALMVPFLSNSSHLSLSCLVIILRYGNDDNLAVVVIISSEHQIDCR